MGSNSPTKSPSKTSKVTASSYQKMTDTELEWCVTPQFIYGGPFVDPVKVEPFLNSATPRNTLLQGTYKQSFAYFSLKERLPIILTKIIDYCAREKGKIKEVYRASDSDIQTYIQYVTKLKNDLVTNKKYDLLTVDTDNAEKWNKWIEGQQQPYYFTNTWIFSECYVYRRLREGCELIKGMNTFDPFAAQKDKSLTDSSEIMCIVADKLVTMLPESAKDKRKADFQTLLKLCLWSNKCDLSLTAGTATNLAGQKGDSGAGQYIDPFQMIIACKDRVLTDDSGKIADNVVAKAAAIKNKIAGPPENEPTEAAEAKPGDPRPDDAKPEEKPRIPCPAKMVVPQHAIFDIICDNAGYELFTDLCLAHFLVSQKIVEKVRFHVKDMPWFVSDVTVRDFRYMIDACVNMNYNNTIPADVVKQAEAKLPETKQGKGKAAKEKSPEPNPEEAAPASDRIITADSVRALGAAWNQLVEDGTFVVMAEDYWTRPHVYKDMKVFDYNLYRKLQYAVALLFKGDLNYRKLLGEVNCNPYLGFPAALQGFHPAPVIAVRTVKAELICGMPKGRYELLADLDPQWMEKGDYGVIQYCPKAEALKVSAVPCIDYGATCFSSECPEHDDL